MAYILHLETATKVCSVALSKNGELVQLKETEEDGYSHGENLTLFIEDVLKKEEISVNDLAAVSVASGPGSYTGLRIGVSTAKGICFGADLPLIAIDALSALCEVAREKFPSDAICAMIDARRMEVFSMIQGGDRKVIKPISADIIEEDSYSDFDPFVYVGDGAEKLNEIWSNRSHLKTDLSIKSSAKGQAKVAFEKFQKKEFEDMAYFEPFYLKDFIAGVKKK